MDTTGNRDKKQGSVRQKMWKYEENRNVEE